MSDTLRYIERMLAYDRGSPTAEWKAVEELLQQFPTEREAISRWLFEKFNGYIDTRSRAGLEFVECNPVEGWSILEHLISSTDPDDHDTALSVLELIDNSCAAQMTLPLLKDKWEYIRLEAAVLLRAFYPGETAECLRNLVQHPLPSVSQEATRLLREIEIVRQSAGPL